MSIKSSALLACPFCGSSDVEVQETDSGIGGLRGEYYVVCWGCYSQTGNNETKREAKRAWNRRHANTKRSGPPADAVVEEEQ